MLREQPRYTMLYKHIELFFLQISTLEAMPNTLIVIVVQIFKLLVQ